MHRRKTALSGSLKFHHCTVRHTAYRHRLVLFRFFRSHKEMKTAVLFRFRTGNLLFQPDISGTWKRIKGIGKLQTVSRHQRKELSCAEFSHGDFNLFHRLSIIFHTGIETALRHFIFIYSGMIERNDSKVNLSSVRVRIIQLHTVFRSGS